MLASDWEQRRSGYDFVIVGSGYGGAITAARLATAKLRKPLTICILERGREWPVGTFPDTLSGILQAARSDLNPLGLYELLNYQDISIVKGSGLGGTSLINANAAIVPDREAFERFSWPASLKYDGLQPYYSRARQMLAVNPHPRALQLKKVQALDRRARELGTAVSAADIAVNFMIDGPNPYGVSQKPCIDCGDCITGCNVGAKNTLCMNYLPIASNAGAHIFTQTKVQWIEKAHSGGWRIHGLRYGADGESGNFTLGAAQVILAAGAINTTEILMRSEAHGLPLSPALGSSFSANGDFFLAYNGSFENDSIGVGTRTPSSTAAEPGPTIAGVVRYDIGLASNRKFSVEDFTFPSAYAQAAKLLFSALRGKETVTRDEDVRRMRMLRDLDPTAQYDPNGALNHALLYLVTGSDDASGAMVFERPWFDPDGRSQLVWNEADRRVAFSRIREELGRHARASQAASVTNPAWSIFDLRHPVSVHPLGGCPMGDDYMAGAVDHHGRVFAGDGSAHQGLYVADGALIPFALSANPLLTIAALAEYIADRKIQELQGRVDPEPLRVPSFAALDPDDVADYPEPDLDRLFRRAPALGIQDMLTQGTLQIDVPRQVMHGEHWRGLLPKGHVLNEMSLDLLAGFNKQFIRSGGLYLGTTSIAGGRILARSSLEEITVDRRTGDLDPGRYVLARYADPPWRGYYEITKPIHQDLMVARVYRGEFPHGVRLFTYPMFRQYGFDRMSVDDHRRLFQASAVPSPGQLQGVWLVSAVANGTRLGGLGFLRFDCKPDGQIATRFQALGLFEALLTPSFLSDHFQLQDFTPFHDEIRLATPDLLAGIYTTQLPAERYVPPTLDFPGILHEEMASGGRRNLCYHYLLERAAGGGCPSTSLLDAFRDIRLPDGVGVNWSEELHGWYFPGVFANAPGPEGDLVLPRYVSSSEKPRDAAPCKLHVAVSVADLNEFIDGIGHEARLTGTLEFGDFQGQGPTTLTADEETSRLSYLQINESAGEGVILYHLEFRTGGGRYFTFQGRKYLQSHGRTRTAEAVLKDYATLFCHIYEGSTWEGRELGTACLKFQAFEDLAATGNAREYLFSLNVTGAGNPALHAIARLSLLAFIGRFLRIDEGQIRADLLARSKVMEPQSRAAAVQSPVPDLVRTPAAPAGESKGGPRIYISYRREDASGYALLLYDRLSRAFGSQRIMMDADQSAKERNAAEAIHQTVRSCDAVIALIDRQWLGRAAEGVPTSLDDPENPVRLEIQAALDHKLRLIPVVVGGAGMPASCDLPPALAAFARRQPLILTESTLNDDVESLIGTLTRLAARNRAPGIIGEASVCQWFS